MKDVYVVAFNGANGWPIVEGVYRSREAARNSRGLMNIIKEARDKFIMKVGMEEEK